MAAKLSFSARAIQDVQEITDFYLQFADQATVDRTMNKLDAELRRLAENDLIKGSRITNLDKNDPTRRWLILNGKYEVFFKRYKTVRGIRVRRIHSSSSQSLTIEDILV